MKILLTDEEMINIVTFPVEPDFELLKAQAKKIAKLIKKDTEDNLFGLSDKLYKTLMEVK